MDETSEIDITLPDARRVEALAGFGLSAEEIARIFGVAPATVEDLFARELAGGQIKANARVAESLYRMALGDGRGAVTAVIFWLKTRARWKEPSFADGSNQLSGANPAENATARFREKIELLAERLKANRE
ncbi:hypothetical protein CSC94_22630 [Zhengella mangrovi]|uniref:Uncharacterized protein n=1 Tax=Zhengella mangrovi TaxID=1982044 RepID=A0A2G1QH05_9HYPH|nr:hypothetical protein [Zhengella mangrovi]PHP64734.1 hypothetical protein CSC94_22630 [Zhengella mangrovi]